MNYELKYTIFKTKWGWFGIAGAENGLVRSCLPLAVRNKVESALLQNLPTARYDRQLSKALQQQITAYFEGTCINFGRDIPIVMDGFSDFTKSVLIACRRIRFGQTITYADLAKKAGFPKAARAVGRVLAKNPLPLIIPCHRVICANGRIGGFSASGGVKMKKRLLLHEKR